MIDYDTAAVNEAVKNLQTFRRTYDFGDIISRILQCKLTGEYGYAILMIYELEGNMT